MTLFDRLRGGNAATVANATYPLSASQSAPSPNFLGGAAPSVYGQDTFAPTATYATAPTDNVALIRQILAMQTQLAQITAQINALLGMAPAAQSAAASPTVVQPSDAAPASVAPVAPSAAPTAPAASPLAPPPPAPAPPPPPAPPAPPPPPPPAPPAAPAPPAPAAPAAPAPAAPATYTVQSGDSLSAIAAATLGSADRWNEIYDLNRDVVGANPSMLYAGQVLKLPNGTNAPAPSNPRTEGPRGKVPYINQYDPDGKANGYYNGPSNCGPTSMAMLLRAHGKGQGMSDAKFINHLGNIGGTSGNGTDVGGIKKMASAEGLASETISGSNVQWMVDRLNQGKLCIANGDYFEMAPHRNTGRTSGHYVTVVGMEGDNFIVNDPADRNVRLVSRGDMARFLSSNPNGGFMFSVG